jgi:hypothetical protein
MPNNRPRPQRVPAQIRLIAARAKPLELLAADGDDPKPPRFTGTAYSGAAMRPSGFYSPVVVDLAGMTIAGGSRPILRDHDPAQVVGHTDSITVARAIRVAGLISGTGEAAAEIVATARNGFPWRLSIGASIERLIAVDDGETAEVNGRKVKGPVLIARKTTLREISFVVLGADDKTSAKIAAARGTPTVEVIAMTFENWLQAKGFDGELTDEQTASLRAMYAAENAPAPEPNPAEITAAAGDGDAGDGEADPMAEFRAQQAAETQRVAAIREITAGDHPEIEAQAITEGWDRNRAELEVLRASRPAGPAIHDATPQVNAAVCEAAIRLAGQEPQDALAAEYGDQTISAADRYRGMGFTGLFQMVAASEGRHAARPGASIPERIEAAFSTATLPTILGDSANKSMISAYRAVDSAARKVAKKLSVSNFLQHTGARLTGASILTKVGEDGELKHGTIGEETFTYQAATYGKIFGITRQMIKNDDLAAFSAIPQMIGRGAALAIEDVFMTLLLANTGSFFASGNSNYISGATTTLASVGLGTAVKTFRQLTDADGYPIANRPRFLLVPPELEVAADELYVSTNVNTGGSSTTAKVPNRNTHAGKYEPVVSPYLSNSSYTGYSTTAWYLLADPADTAAFGICYLDGRETPTIEDAPLPSDLLGKAWRGFLDFGCAQVDSRGGVKSKGAA